MPEPKIELYKCSALKDWGFSYALLAGFTDQANKEVVAEAFMFRMTVKGEFHFVDKVRVGFALTGVDLSGLGLDEASEEAYGQVTVWESALEHCQLYISEHWLGISSGAPKPFNPLPSLEPHPKGPWKRGLLQLRFRGLPDSIVADMEKFFTPPTAKQFLFELPRIAKSIRIQTF